MDSFKAPPLEATLQIVREVQVFPRLPPRTSTKGYRAQDWDPNTIWKGRMRVLQITYASGDALLHQLGSWMKLGKDVDRLQPISICVIKLEDATSGELFGEAIVRDAQDSQLAVESVTDSSRYFILRLTDRASGRSAFCGLGFAERTDAFDFNVALQEFHKLVKYERQGAAPESKPLAPALPNLSLGEGQKIELNLNQLAKKLGANASNGNLFKATSSASDPFSFPPPPSSVKSVPEYTSSASKSDDEWTDFTAPTTSQANTNLQTPSGWVQF